MDALHALLHVDNGADTLRLWTGADALTYGGEDYQGGRLFALSSGGGSALRSTERMGVSLAISEDADRDLYLRRIGAPPVTVTFIATTDGGQTWLEVTEVQGRVSNPLVVGLVYSFDVRPRSPVADRGEILYLNHEDRQKLFPGDQGLKQMARLADGGITLGWPATLVEQD